MSKEVILINGLKRSGKDFTASALKEAFETVGKSVRIHSFAAPMKCIISKTFNITLSELDDYKNANARFKLSLVDMVDGDHGLTTDFRTILQRFGTEAMKPIFGDNVWAYLARDIIQEASEEVIIFADFRFIDEYNVIKAMDDVEVTTVYVQGKESETTDTHISECKPAIQFHYELDNSKQDGTVTDWAYNYAGY